MTERQWKSLRGANGWLARATKGPRADGLSYWQARVFVGGPERELTKALGWTDEAGALALLAKMPSARKFKQEQIRTTLDPKWTNSAIRDALGLILPPRERAAGRRMLYLMRCLGYVKIGITSNLVDRVEDLQSACPEEIVLIGACDGDRLLEGTLHKVAHRFHVRGEWFYLCDTVIDLLRGAVAHWREKEAEPRDTCDHIFYCPRRHGQPERPGPFLCMLERGHRGKCRQGVATPS